MTSTKKRLARRVVIATASLMSLGLVADGTFASTAASAVAFPAGNGGDVAVWQAAAALDALRSGSTAEADQALHDLAGSIGPRVEIDPARLEAAWTAAGSGPGMIAMLSALTQLGVSYRYASSNPGVAFDCSGLVHWAWSQAGVNLPSNSSAIIRSSANTSTDELEPGDVMWYPGHVMLSLGVDDAYVHAVGRGKVLEVHSMWPRKKGRIKAIDPAG